MKKNISLFSLLVTSTSSVLVVGSSVNINTKINNSQNYNDEKNIKNKVNIKSWENNSSDHPSNIIGSTNE